MGKDQPRSLEEICIRLGSAGFEIVINENHYCSIRPAGRIECQYRETKPDKNGLYVCNKPEEYNNG